MTCTNLIDVIADALQSPSFSMSETVAMDLAQSIIRAAAERGHAGSDYYLPLLRNMDRAERNAMIRTEFKGNNLREVCRKFGVSKTTVYRACRRGE